MTLVYMDSCDCVLSMRLFKRELGSERLHKIMGILTGFGRFVYLQSNLHPPLFPRSDTQSCLSPPLLSWTGGAWLAILIMKLRLNRQGEKLRTVDLRMYLYKIPTAICYTWRAALFKGYKKPHKYINAKLQAQTQFPCV